MTWTVYFDSHKGFEKRTDYGAYIIEGDRYDADSKFINETGLKPNSKTCPCCARDFYVMEFSSLEEAEFACCTDRVLYLSR